MLPLLGTLLPSVLNVINNYISDDTKRKEIEKDLTVELVSRASSIEKAAADIVRAEVEGESWLQKNWRPLGMFWIMGLITAHFLGFTVPNLDADAVNTLYNLLSIGFGGYVVGRSAEKIVKTVVNSPNNPLENWKRNRD